MKHKCKKLIYFLIFLFCLGTSNAVERRSTDPLNTITDVRAMGMGRAGLATLGGSNALFANPAGLTKIKNIEGSIFSTKLMDEFNYFGINGAMKLDSGWWAAGYGSMSIDGIPETFRYTQGSGTRTYQLSEYSAGNNFICLGYASKVPLWGDMSLGFNLKRATEYIEAGENSTFDSSSSSGFGIDAGVMLPLVLFERDYEAGLVIQNLISPTFKEEGEDDSKYATNIRLGISTKVQFWSQDFLLAVDNDILGIHLGAEWQGPGGFAIRSGYD
ncbi:MAG: conjugal transfer protein TraF, partial [Candidatus Margulisbacteria bacterium]|nr:conjugal transfer protein TraF [Candidatus Margulisiibacteriota bacterium]